MILTQINMANKIFRILFLLAFVFDLTVIGQAYAQRTGNVIKADATLKAVYQLYAVDHTQLLSENYPKDDSYKATYLAGEDTSTKPNSYSYLWPFSGTFSAVNALYEATGDAYYLDILDKKVLVGLEQYLDTKRKPFAYSSYISTAPQSDRFYDDNIWLGIDFTDIYRLTKKKEYLKKAKQIWKFIESGTDDVLGGGIYWCEQKKESKNTCSNAPGAVFALKLYLATMQKSYLKKGKNLFEWTRKTLQDSSDNLYFDNISLQGKISKAKYAYNSGQMIQAAVLLYKITGETEYLEEARTVASSCFNHFFYVYTDSEGKSHRLIKNGNIWFTAVMLRGFIELYSIDKNSTYLKEFQSSLDYAWEHAKEDNGLFNTDYTGQTLETSKWLLTQAAFAEMFARLPEMK